MVPLLESVALAQGGLFTRSQAAAAGYTDSEMRRMLRGEWAAVARGYYADATAWSRLSPRDHHLALAGAYVASRPDVVLSHRTAALLHGLPLLTPPALITLSKANGSDVRREDLRVVVTPVDSAARTKVRGLAVTSVARTVVDCARTSDFAEAVVIADAALAFGLVTPSELAATAAAQSHWPGVPAARRVLSFADGRAETPGESLSRITLARLGLPRPDLQVEIVAPDGTVWRVDFLWRAERVIGEFDGRVKYAGDRGADALFAEKVREDGLREIGFIVVRWIWSDLMGDTSALDRRVRRALERGRRSAA